jgi:hypothetical protein
MAKRLKSHPTVGKTDKMVHRVTNDFRDSIVVPPPENKQIRGLKKREIGHGRATSVTVAYFDESPA